MSLIPRSRQTIVTQQALQLTIRIRDARPAPPRPAPKMPQVLLLPRTAPRILFPVGWGSWQKKAAPCIPDQNFENVKYQTEIYIDFETSPHKRSLIKKSACSLYDVIIIFIFYIIIIRENKFPLFIGIAPIWNQQLSKTIHWHGLRFLKRSNLIPSYIHFCKTLKDDYFKVIRLFTIFEDKNED